MPKGVYPRSKEYKKRMTGEGNPFYGKKHTLEAIEKIRKDNLENPRRYWLGKTFSKKMIRNMRKAQLGKKLIIELFGEYWHEDQEVEIRRSYFANYGYKTLVIWGSELKKESKIIEKVKELYA